MNVIIEERNINVDGLPVRYLTGGEGSPLVLLHALGESALNWRWVLPALARTHRVYAVDLPGFGFSAKPSAEYTPAFFARFIGAYLDALGLERTGLVGSSLGGLVALRLALAEPARVSALVLVASAAPLRTSRARPRRMDNRANPNSATARLYGGGGGRPACSGRPGRAAG